MATTIDTKSLTDIITEFRKITAKDAITPESLGAILQRIADLLATAGTQETAKVLTDWYNSLRTAPNYISSIVQGNVDRNDVKLTVSTVGIRSGMKVTLPDNIIIRQATTERAGAMRAQQVTDLNAARRGVADLEKATALLNDTLAQLLAKLGLGDGSSISSVFNTAQISCQVIDGKLHVFGAQNLAKAGYVPYLFRFTRKRNQFHDRLASPEERAKKKYCAKSKGWHVYGSCHAVKVSGTQVLFSTNSHGFLHRPCTEYTADPMSLFTTHQDRNGHECVGWARSSVRMDDYKFNNNQQRMLRFRFAIGFAKKILPGKIAITPANLVSSLAEFSLVYNPAKKTWHLSK